ncbi:MAG: peptidylprolyl isomerase [Fidelibacterota bacterium]|nr:MAG: peptidylprolyl isomerase [Candidatus Neomarinimicrobiota bacterium]
MTKWLFIFIIPFVTLAQELVDGVAAIVGDNIILKSDVLQLAQLNAIQNRVDIYSQPELVMQFQNVAFDALLLQKVLLFRAKIDSMDIIPEEEVDLALEQQIETILAQVGSESRFEETIGQSVRDFRSDHWDDIRDQIIAERYQADKIQSISVTRDEVEEFYKTYKDSLPPIDNRYELSQIILAIRPGESAYEEAYELISLVHQRLMNGEPFAELARELSDDPASRDNGGDLGFVRRGEFVRQYEEVAFSMSEGQISDIVESIFGYHIIQLIEKQGERIHTRHILVTAKPSDEDRDRVLDTTRDYYFLLQDSVALFDSLVQALSVDDESNLDLGYIGWIEYSQLPHEAYRSALFGVSSGDITPPFETAQGFHILKVLNFKEGGTPNLEEYYPQISFMALRQKQAKYMDLLLENSRKELFIKTLY